MSGHLEAFTTALKAAVAAYQRGVVFHGESGNDLYLRAEGTCSHGSFAVFAGVDTDHPHPIFKAPSFLLNGKPKHMSMAPPEAVEALARLMQAMPAIVHAAASAEPPSPPFAGSRQSIAVAACYEPPTGIQVEMDDNPLFL